jgi:hypothetical protein
MTPDEVAAIQQRYTVPLSSANQIIAFQIASCARSDVPRLVAALQEAYAEQEALRDDIAQLRAELAAHQISRATQSWLRWPTWWLWFSRGEPDTPLG